MPFGVVGRSGEPEDDFFSSGVGIPQQEGANLFFWEGWSDCVI